MFAEGGSMAPPGGKSANCCGKTKEQDLENDGVSVTQTQQAEASGGPIGKWGLPRLTPVGGPPLGQSIEGESYNRWSVLHWTPFP